MTDQRTLFPEPAKNEEGCRLLRVDRGRGGERTLAIDPQERGNGFPFAKYSALKEPLGRSLMLDTARDVIIR